MKFVEILRALVSSVVGAIVDIRRFWNPGIFGVEVTQAIQHYRASDHLTDPNDRGPDNSIQLVARKPAWVRVYVRNGVLNVSTTVSGSLSVERRRHGFLWSTVTTISPQPPGSLTTQTVNTYANERGNSASTLNFVIPADEFYGNLRLKLTLTGNSGGQVDTRNLFIDATLEQTLRIRAILVSYNGPSTFVSNPPPPNLQLAAPTLADLQATAAIALRAMPVQSSGSFASAGTLAWNLPLDDPRSCAGCCSANWNQLLNALTNQRTNDGNRADVVYYGLLPAGIPLGVPGCGQGGLGSAATGNQWTLFHEIGHGYGFQHTPCGNTGTPDPNYPVYEPYPSASIGEYGLDISNGNVLSPQTTFDYMSYCGPRWISLYQHKRLIQHPRLDPDWITDRPWWKDYFEQWPPWWKWPLPDPPPLDIWKGVEMLRVPIISVSGIVRSASEIEVTTVARTLAAGAPPGDQTGLSVLLKDEKGEAIGSGAIYRLPTHGACGCDDEGMKSPYPYNFQAFVGDVAPGAALAIRDADGKEIWSRTASAKPPSISDLRIELSKDDELALKWKQGIASDTFEAWLQWSNDEGASWNGLTTGITDSHARVSIAGLPAGHVLMRVLLHDGFYTAVSEPAGIELPERPPEVAILHPADGQTLEAGRTMHLWGAATDAAGIPLPTEACSWRLNDKDVGKGMELWLEAPPAGEHRVTFAAGGPGGEAEVTVCITTVDYAEREKQSTEK